jgi:hypothetical protein
MTGGFFSAGLSSLTGGAGGLRGGVTTVGEGGLRGGGGGFTVGGGGFTVGGCAGAGLSTPGGWGFAGEGPVCAAARAGDSVAVTMKGRASFFILEGCHAARAPGNPAPHLSENAMEIRRESS